jgi:hypothetical protein
MQQLPTHRISSHRPSVYISLILLLLLSLELRSCSAIPTWYNIGTGVVYSSNVEWMIVSTVSDAMSRWQFNMSADSSMPILVQPLYSNATLRIEMIQRVLATATWRVTESQDLLVVVRTYTHEVRQYSDTVEIGRFEVKGAVWPHELDATYPDLFIGFDPSYLKSNPTGFTVGNMHYKNLGIEGVKTPWGVRDAYHLLGTSGDASTNQTWDRWCDITSGIVLKSDLRQYSGQFGNLQYYESYREVLVIKEANFDVTHFEEEPWYQMSFYSIPLWVIILGITAVVAFLLIQRRRTKPIEF